MLDRLKSIGKPPVPNLPSNLTPEDIQRFHALAVTKREFLAKNTLRRTGMGATGLLGLAISVPVELAALPTVTGAAFSELVARFGFNQDISPIVGATGGVMGCIGIGVAAATLYALNEWRKAGKNVKETRESLSSLEKKLGFKSELMKRYDEKGKIGFVSITRWIAEGTVVLGLTGLIAGATGLGGAVGGAAAGAISFIAGNAAFAGIARVLSYGSAFRVNKEAHDVLSAKKKREEDEKKRAKRGRR